MASTTLLSLAGVITKDPNNIEYPKTVKYDMLSMGQEAIISLIDEKYLENVVTKTTFSGIASATVETNIPTNFFRPYYMETSAGVPVFRISLKDKDKLQNVIEGGNDIRPIYYYRDDNGTKKVTVLQNTYPVTVDFFYIFKPPTLSDTVNPYILGFDSHILTYFKYLFHLTEGRTDLAQEAYNTFLNGLSNFRSQNGRQQ